MNGFEQANAGGLEKARKIEFEQTLEQNLKQNPEQNPEQSLEQNLEQNFEQNPGQSPEQDKKNRQENKAVNKQEMLATIRECAEKCGHVPSITELTKMTNVTRRQMRRHFGSFTRALRECKLERAGGGWRVDMETLLRDWTRVARAIKKIPSGSEYELASAYTLSPLVRRFGNWTQVPYGLKKYVEDQGWTEEFSDVLEMIAAQEAGQHARRALAEARLHKGVMPDPGYELGAGWGSGPAYGESAAMGYGPAAMCGFAPAMGMGNGVGACNGAGMGIAPATGAVYGDGHGAGNGARRLPRAIAGRPLYGPLMRPYPLIHGPVNEAGVLFLFGAMAERLGFVMTRIQAEFPDGEAMRLVEGYKWQRVHIEFEYESRNFLRHLHDPKECDLIVCWEHNWPECPVGGGGTAEGGSKLQGVAGRRMEEMKAETGAPQEKWFQSPFPPQD